MLKYGDDTITEQRVWRFLHACTLSGSSEWAKIARDALSGDAQARVLVTELISETYFEACVQNTDGTPKDPGRRPWAP